MSESVDTETPTERPEQTEGDTEEQSNSADERSETAEAEPSQSDAEESADDTSDDDQQPRTYDEAYVKGLREEAKGHRKKAQEAKAELEKAQQQVKSLQDELDKRERVEQLDKLRRDVAAEASVPAEALRGESREELEAHAEVLKSTFDSLINSGSGSVPKWAGTGPEKTPARDLRDIERESYEQITSR